MELQEFSGRLQQRGWRLSAITIDAPDVLQRFASERRLTFPLFSGREAIASVGLKDPRFDGDPQRKGAPFPVIYLLGPDGRITERFFDDERISIKAILARTGVVEPSAPVEVRNPLARVRIWSPDATASPGTTATLAFEVTPALGIHLYAPGNHPYGAITARLDTSDMVTASRLALPKPVPYTFKPLNETVPVYEQPFTAFQEVRIAAGAKADSVVVSGVLEFQGCDDRLCYPPQRVPFSVRFKLAE